MKEKVEEILGGVVNSLSGKTLSEENRIQKIEASSSGLMVEYNRTGLNPSDKRKLEDLMISSLEGHYKDEDITLFSVSKDSEEVFKAHGVEALGEEAKDDHGHSHSHDHSDGSSCSTSSTNNANLKVGHGPVGENKKRIPNVKNIIAIASGKGGVGKSTVSANLAMTLKNMGKSVGVIDADIYGPSLPMIFGKRDAKPVANENQKILPIESHGIKFMSFGLFIEEAEPVIWRGPMLGGVLNQFLFDVDWGNLDYMIIDLPPGTGDMQLSMVQNLEVDGVAIVSTPQDVALLDAKKGLEMFTKMEIPVLGMIENMSYFVTDESDKKYYIFGKAGVVKACEDIKTNFLGEIPLEIELREASDKGEPYMNNPSFEGRSVWNGYMEVAKSLESALSGKDNKGFFKKLFSKD